MKDRAHTSVERILVGTPTSVGTGDVVLVSASGALVTLTDGWEYLEPGNITAISPTLGHEGTLVTIVGANLRMGGARVDTVYLAGVEVDTVVNHTDDVVIVRASPGNASMGDVVIVSDTGATTTLAGAWTYVQQGAIVSVTPQTGQLGTRVTIRGAGLRAGSGGVRTVLLGGEVALSILFENETTVIAVAADIVPGSGLDSIIIIADTGAFISRTGVWNYSTPSNVTSLTPAEGQVGTIVSIFGTRLLGGGGSIDRVVFGTTPASSVSGNDTVVVATVARSNVSAVVDVTVVADTGAYATQLNAFTFRAEGNIVGVAPATGQGGTYITITGTELLGGGTVATQVSLADVAVLAIESANDTVVIVRAGAATGASVGAVRVTSNTGAIVTLVGGFTYRAPGSIVEVDPAVGQEGTIVTIRGTGLLGSPTGTLVSALFAGTPGSILLQNGTQVTVRVGANTSATVGDVRLEGADGALIVAPDAWAYVAAGRITAVSPASGQQGTFVTITGERLLGNGTVLATVSIGGVLASIQSATDTHVVVRPGASVAGNATIVLTADTGAVITDTDVVFAYLEPSEMATVNPSSGQAGTRVTVTGVRLRGDGDNVSVVSLAGETSIVVSENDTYVVAVAPDGTAGIGDVVLQASNGALALLNNNWTFITRGDINATIPTSGQEGTYVTITGTGLLGGGARIVSATLVGVSVTDIVVSNDTIVVVEAGRGPASPLLGDVAITADTGAITTRTSAFTYNTPGTIVTVSPSQGGQGARVTIIGNFLCGAGEIWCISIITE